MELLYSLPAIGATQTSSVATCLNTAATAPPFQLPALQNIWSPSQITGKGIMIIAAGGYDIPANTLSTFRLSLDTSSGVTAVNTVATLGAYSIATQTVGAWQAELFMTCTGVTSETASTWYSMGQLTIGPGSSPTGTASTLLWGQPSIAAGVPTAVTIPTNAAYYVNLVSQWQTTPTAMVCSQFLVFGLN